MAITDSQKLGFICVILLSSQTCNSQCNGTATIISGNGILKSPDDIVKRVCIWKTAKAPNMVTVFYLRSLNIVNVDKHGPSNTCRTYNKLLIDGEKIHRDPDVKQNISKKQFCYAFAYQCVKLPSIENCKMKNVSRRVEVKYKVRSLSRRLRDSVHGFEMTYQTLGCREDDYSTFSSLTTPQYEKSTPFFTISAFGNETTVGDVDKEGNGSSGPDVLMLGSFLGGLAITVTCVAITVWYFVKKREGTNTNTGRSFVIGEGRLKVPEATYAVVGTHETPDNEYEPIETFMSTSAASAANLTSPNQPRQAHILFELSGYQCPTPMSGSPINDNGYQTTSQYGQPAEVRYDAIIENTVFTAGRYEIVEAEELD